MGYKSGFKGSTVVERLRGLPRFVEITYGELVKLRDDGKLVPGRQYRIIDYKPTTKQSGTIVRPEFSTFYFDVIVLALTNDTLAERAWACHHDGNTYFQNSHLAAWQIWYCLDNDTSRFAWADSDNGKGVIYRMIDEFNNDFPYDFKNIMFKPESVFRFESFITDFGARVFCFSAKGSRGALDASLDGTIRNNVIKRSGNNIPFVVFFSTEDSLSVENNYVENCDYITVHNSGSYSVNNNKFILCNNVYLYDVYDGIIYGSNIGITSRGLRSFFIDPTVTFSSFTNINLPPTSKGLVVSKNYSEDSVRYGYLYDLF